MRFIERGANLVEADSVFRRLPDSELQCWIGEWTRLAEPLE